MNRVTDFAVLAILRTHLFSRSRLSLFPSKSASALTENRHLLDQPPRRKYGYEGVHFPGASSFITLRYPPYILLLSFACLPSNDSSRSFCFCGGIRDINRTMDGNRWLRFAFCRVTIAQDVFVFVEELGREIELLLDGNRWLRFAFCRVTIAQDVFVFVGELGREIETITGW